MTTYNNIIKRFETFADNHYQLEKFFSGKTWNFQAIDESFPALIVYPATSTVEPGVMTLKFNIFIADILSRSSGNLDEIYSDTMSIVLDMFSYFRDNETEFGFTVSNFINTEPFEEEFDEIVAGWSTTFEVEVEYDGSVCDLPMADAVVGPEFSCNNPIPGNVRLGITYGNDDVYTGTLIVPDPSNVVLGVPTDNTVGTYVAPTGWVRPEHWLARPDVAVDESVIWLLVKVDEGTDTFIKTLVSYNDWEVDWGDTESGIYFPNIAVEHKMNYDGITDYYEGTTKQTWVKITGRNIDLSKVSFAYYYTALRNSANINIIEALVGKLTYTIDKVQFYNCMGLVSVVFTTPMIMEGTNNYLLRSCFSLENIEGEITGSGTDINRYIINAGSRLTNIDSLTISCNLERYAFNMCAVPGHLNLENCTIGYTHYTFASSKFRELTVDATNWTYAYFMCNRNYSAEKYNFLNSDGSNVTNFGYAFTYNQVLPETPVLNLISSTQNSQMFNQCYNLRKSNLTNISASIGFNGCSLDHDEVLNVANNCNTVTTATIDLRYNVDIANLPLSTLAIFTGKNWTVLI